MSEGEDMRAAHQGIDRKYATAEGSTLPDTSLIAV